MAKAEVMVFSVGVGLTGMSSVQQICWGVWEVLGFS